MEFLNYDITNMKSTIPQYLKQTKVFEQEEATPMYQNDESICEKSRRKSNWQVTSAGSAKQTQLLHKSKKIKTK